MADHYDMVLCSTNWEGLTGNEEIPDAALLADLSNFTTLPDHLTQSLINALYLGRLMTAHRGSTRARRSRRTAAPGSSRRRPR